MWILWYILVLIVSFVIWFLYRIGPRGFIVYAVCLGFLFWLIGGGGFGSILRYLKDNIPQSTGSATPTVVTEKPAITPPVPKSHQTVPPSPRPSTEKTSGQEQPSGGVLPWKEAPKVEVTRGAARVENVPPQAGESPGAAYQPIPAEKPGSGGASYQPSR